MTSFVRYFWSLPWEGTKVRMGTAIVSDRTPGFFVRALLACDRSDVDVRMREGVFGRLVRVEIWDARDRLRWSSSG